MYILAVKGNAFQINPLSFTITHLSQCIPLDGRKGQPEGGRASRFSPALVGGRRRVAGDGSVAGRGRVGGTVCHRGLVIDSRAEENISLRVAGEGGGSN